MARDPKELRAARRRARLSATGQRQAEKATRRARAIRQEYERANTPDGGSAYTIDQLVRIAGAKPCADSRTGRFDGLPRYSATTVRYGIENMSDYERRLVVRISSADYRERASRQGSYNNWWYHSSRVKRV